MKTTSEILALPHYANKIESQFGMTVTDIKEAMREFAAQYKDAFTPRCPCGVY